jgi:hypothetical protein
MASRRSGLLFTSQILLCGRFAWSSWKAAFISGGVWLHLADFWPSAAEVVRAPSVLNVAGVGVVGVESAEEVAPTTSALEKERMQLGAARRE